ncbi:MAG: flagellar hook-associated protein FlgK [Epsilonproteobacteria bacterium]|nr:flagellar hook-associated protein FlgK [Campylobacterota bacterium]
MGMFSSLYTGYSGLKTNQNAIATTSNNISNASNKDYTRQRTQIVSNISVHTYSGDIGTGSKVQTIVRVKDDYLFSRYETSNRDLQYYSTLQSNVNEVAQYFPDVQDVGLNKNIQDYFNAWNDFANNPTDNAMKVNLASKTKILTDNIQETRSKIDDLSKSANDKIKVYGDEVNLLIKNIANLNKEITKVEANKNDHANELRDQRDAAEKRLIELTGAKVSKIGIQSMGGADPNIADYEENYVITLGGYPIVDNATYHPIEVEPNPQSRDGYYSVYFEKQDYTKVDITNDIPKNNIMGGLLEFRGTHYDVDGKVTDGYSGKYIDELDAFSRTLIQSTNSLYAYSAQEEPVGQQIAKPVSLTDDQINKYSLDSAQVRPFLHNEVRDGTLTLSAYDNNGKFVQDVDIQIDKDKTLQQNLDAINNELQNNNIDYEATIQNGNVVFKKVDNDGNGSLDNGALLVKDDGSWLFNALNKVQYKPLTKSNDEDFDLPIKDGSFDVVVYNDDGDELARRTIVVNSQSKDPLYSTTAGVLAQINMANIDDNDDNDDSDDVDDYYHADFINGSFVFNKNTDETTYVGLDNDTSNFGGSIGLNKFFSGHDSSDITLDRRFIDSPEQLHAYKAPSEGNNDTANDMVQLQYDKLEFHTQEGTNVNTISGYYRYMVSNVANDSSLINDKVDTSQAVYNTVEQQYQSVSGVNLDEEMTDLMKYQTGYQAATKVINTISSMLDALMGMKT